MAKQLLQIGTTPNDGNGDNLRLGAQKINDNFEEIYSALGNGNLLTDVITNGTLDLPGSNKVAALFATYGDLPDPSVYHGMFAHVHNEGRGYFAHAGNWTEIVDVTSSIGKLNDVNLSTPPSSGQVLKWNGSQWTPQNDIDTQLSLGSASIGDLSDIDISSVASSYILQYNGSSGKFEAVPQAGAETLDQLNDVSTSGKLNGDTILWNSNAGFWEPGKPDYTLGQLTNVDTAGASNGDALVYDSTSAQFTVAQHMIIKNVDTIVRDVIADISNGMMVYNTDTNKFQGYANGAWVDLH